MRAKFAGRDLDGAELDHVGIVHVRDRVRHLPHGHTNTTLQNRDWSRHANKQLFSAVTFVGTPTRNASVT